MSNIHSNMYQNKFDKKLDNTQKVYSTLYEQRKENDKNEIKNIDKKIVDIFKSPKYVYKVDVVIEMDDDIIDKRIIGKNKDYLITIDNEYIPIVKIKDIYLK